MSREAAVLVPRPLVGDSLVSMVVAENLRRRGHAVTVVSREIADLAAWFPGFEILDPRDVRAVGALARPGLVVHQARHSVGPRAPLAGQELVVVNEHPAIDRSRSRVAVYAEFCRRRFEVGEPTLTNGMRLPAELAATGRAGGAREPGLVVLHPGAREPHRAWPADRFLALADRIAAGGGEPVLLVPPEERAAWELRAGSHPVVVHDTLDGAAGFLLEAGCFVGNDSGIGHLASSVGTPTVTIFMRPRLARHWRPAWSPSEAVLPLLRLPSTWLQNRTWHRFVGVSRVYAAIERLRDFPAPGASGMP